MRDPAHHRLLYAFGPQRVVILPDAPLSRSRPHRQHSPSHACTFDFAQVSLKLVVELRIDKIPHRRSQHFFDAVAQQTRWNGIDRQESPVKVVNAQQVVAVLNQIAAPVFVFFQVLPDSVPRDGRFFRKLAFSFHGV